MLVPLLDDADVKKNEKTALMENGKKVEIKFITGGCKGVITQCYLQKNTISLGGCT